MKPSAHYDEENPLWMNQQQLATLLGVSCTAVMNAEKRRDPQSVHGRGRQKRYWSPHWVEWLREDYKRQIDEARTERPAHADRKAEAEAKLKELQVAERMGELVTKAEAAELFRRMQAPLASVLAMVARKYPRIAEQIMNALKLSMAEMRAEWNGYTPELSSKPTRSKAKRRESSRAS